MANDLEARAHGLGRRHTKLPVLTWTLLGLLFIWLVVWFFFQRPTTEERLQVASFARALREIEGTYVAEVDREALYRAAMASMVRSLGDKYSTYLSPAQMQRVGEETRGEFGGIGVLISPRTDRVLIEDVLPDGPAERAGLEPGDVITRVDGAEVAGLPLEEVVSILRGEPGTQVVVTVSRPDTEESLTFTLERDKVRAPNIRWEILEDQIALLRVRTFDRHTAGDLRKALDEMLDQGAAALIIDLRGNSGGLVKQAVLVCDMFLEEGLILALDGRTVQDEPPLEAKPGVAVERRVPVAVLVDRWTASAAEILAGTLQAHGRATVVGTRTVGKGAVTSVLEMPDESGVMLTVAHYRLEGGLVIEGNGVQPDVVVGELPEPPQDLKRPEALQWLREKRAAAREQQLAKAVEILKERLARE